MAEVIEIKPNADTPHILRASVYRGIGNVRKVSPQGEIQARPGDVLLELPGGMYVMDQLSAVSIFGDSLDEIIKPFEGQKSQRELEDLSSPTHPANIREQEAARVESLKKQQEDVDAVQKAAIESARADAQNIGGEIRSQVTQTHLRNVGGEIRQVEGEHPAMRAAKNQPITQEEKFQIEKENQTFQGGVDFLQNPPLAPQSQVPGGGESPVEETGAPEGTNTMAEAGLDEDQKDEIQNDTKNPQQSNLQQSPSASEQNPQGSKLTNNVPPAFRKTTKR